LVNAAPFTELAGPIYQTASDLEADEPIRFGFRVAHKHLNGTDGCHGGMLTTFLDIALVCALFARLSTVGGMPTVSMMADFPGAGGVGRLDRKPRPHPVGGQGQRAS
jgi:acyl-coenzyme A thioesterase PaaI-like protein